MWRDNWCKNITWISVTVNQPASSQRKKTYLKVKNIHANIRNTSKGTVSLLSFFLLFFFFLFLLLFKTEKGKYWHLHCPFHPHSTFSVYLSCTHKPPLLSWVSFFFCSPFLPPRFIQPPSHSSLSLRFTFTLLPLGHPFPISFFIPFSPFHPSPSLPPSLSMSSIIHPFSFTSR